MILFWLIIFIIIIFSTAVLIRPLLTNNGSYTLTAIAVSLFIPLFSLFLYFHFGNYQQVAQWKNTKERSALIKQEINKLGSRTSIILALRNRLESLPLNAENAKGWFILGKLYASQGQVNEAIASFNKAKNLKPEDIEYSLQYVMTKFLVSKNLDQESQSLLNEILRKHPNNINAINLLAANAYLQKKYTIAIRYWESLLPYFAPDSSDAKELLSMIRQAQDNLAPPKNSDLKIFVHIEIDKELKSKINTQESLFVYALESQGPSIPLAVVKQAVSMDQINVVLDNSLSMIADKQLGKQKEIYIEARISPSGNALPSKGDLVGKSKIFKLIQNNTHVNIKIDSIKN